MKHSTGKPTKAEKQRFQDLLEIGCIACFQIDRYSIPEIHHLLSGNKRRGHMFTVPLCPWHHRGYNIDSIRITEMCYGPSLARNPRKFRERFGTDEELLAMVNGMVERAAA